jgi:hypothetical protein
LLQI